MQLTTIPYPSKGSNGDKTMNINKVLITDALRTVQKTQSRFISIIAIVALGVSFFAGMNAISPDMYDTMRDYALEANMSDIQIISTAGLTDNDVAVENIKKAGYDVSETIKNTEEFYKNFDKFCKEKKQ